MTLTEARPQRRRAALAWTGIIGGLVAVGVSAAAIVGVSTMPAIGLLDPDAAGPQGARAVVEVLRERGVEVRITRDRVSTLAALAEADATLAVADTAPLEDADLSELAEAAETTVLLQPRSRDLRLLLDGASPAGFGDGAAADASCDLPSARAAAEIVPGEVFALGDSGVACFASGAGHAVLALRDEAVAVDATVLFVNDALASNGNAALAMNLLGGTGVVVWYLPALGDGSLALAPSLGELTPPWVTPAILILLSATIVAAVWRGRRFGPLVAENLPVTVRAAETSEGRARLYARAGDPVHALDQLRRDALARCARLLGLATNSDAGAIADAVASRLGADRARIRAVLLDDLPRTDRDLVDAADRLRDLESAVRTTVRPERNTP